MGIDELKRWHWVFIGVVVGLAFAAIRVWALSDPPPDGAAHANPLQFESMLMQPPLRSGEAFVTDITVYPALDGMYPVRFKELTPTADKKGWVYQPSYMVAKTPYVSKLDPSDNPETFVEFMTRTAKGNSRVNWRYAWWAESQWQYVLWTIGSAVVIGGAWPTVLGVLIGAGFGPKKKEEKYDLERFGKYKEAAKEPAKKEITAEEQAQVAAVAAKLEEELGGFGTEGAGGAAAGGPGAAAEARKLDGGPMEQVAVNKEEDDKDYKGEFYPVARPQGHKQQDEAGRGVGR